MDEDKKPTPGQTNPYDRLDRNLHPKREDKKDVPKGGSRWHASSGGAMIGTAFGIADS